jgi:hypothetical protein
MAAERALHSSPTPPSRRPAEPERVAPERDPQERHSERDPPERHSERDPPERHSERDPQERHSERDRFGSRSFCRYSSVAGAGG